jgi:hypothetical protein
MMFRKLHEKIEMKFFGVIYKTKEKSIRWIKKESRK